MRIGIDCRLGGPRHAGIGRYIENLVIRLPALDVSSTWVFFYHDAEQKQRWQSQLSEISNIEWVHVPIRHYTLSEQLKMPAFFASANLDILHVPHFNIPLAYSGKLVITIHDLLWHEYYGTGVTTLPTWQYWLKYIAYRWITSAAVRKANRILVPAQTIKQTLAKYFPDALEKVVVTKEGVSQEFKSSSVKQKQEKQLVYVGSLYPHKNIDVVIDSLAKLPDYTLVIVGARTIFQDRTKILVDRVGVHQQVKFVGYLPDSDLAQLLQRSSALVQPSLSEGFGLTGVEAMAAGVPVVASNIPIFHEIYQKAATFFDPQSVDSFVEAVQKVEKSDRALLRSQGQAIAKTYSWDKMARETLQVYHQAQNG